MHRTRNFFTALFFIGILFFGIYLYVQYKINQENERIAEAIEQKKYDVVLEAYAKLTPENFKPDGKGIRRCFYKAYALQHTGHEREAMPYWTKILDNSGTQRYRMHAYLYMAQTAMDEKNYDFAESCLKKPELMDPAGELFADASFYLARIYYQKNEMDNAVALLQPLIKAGGNEKLLKSMKDLAGEINIKRIFSRRITSDSVDYTIHAGDTLSALADRYKTTPDLIRKTNSLVSSVLRQANHIKIVKSNFSIKVSKTKNILTVYENGEFFKEYLVGTGRDNVTPIGKFYIVDKQVNPTWFRHDGQVIPFGTKENLLGTRWMSINYPGYGIHGTWEDDSVGKQSSAGCIRLRNSDVEELFIYVPANTEVEISES